MMGSSLGLLFSIVILYLFSFCMYLGLKKIF